MTFTSYAQNFEDVMLRRALGSIDRGFYIDVGAADPVEMSVTKAFYDAGWRGVNIEPGRHYHERLAEARPEDVNLDVALAETEGTRTFHEIPQTGLSTLHGDIATGHRNEGHRVATRPVRLMTLAQVCRDHAKGDIHFLKIDVEGAEGEVLAGGDFKAFRPWIVLLEATKPLTTEDAADWEPILLAAGYVFVWFDGLNRFYVVQERHAELAPHFILPPNSFDLFTVFDAKAAENVQRLREQDSEIALLEQETLLLRTMQDRSDIRSAELEDAQVQQMHELAALKSEAVGLKCEVVGLKREIADLLPFRTDLQTLVFSLRWDDGPRALKLVLPLARIARRVMGGGARPASAPETVHHEAPDQTRP